MDEPVPQRQAEWPELIRKAQAGDRDALEEIIAAHESKVLHVSWKMLFDPDDARDAAQEVFMRLVKYLPSLDREQSLSGWFYRTTVNVCLDMERRRRRWAWLPFQEEDETEGRFAFPASLPLEERLALSEEVDRAVRGLKQLPARERAVLVLRDVEGLDTQEVARILGSSETTVRSQASRARVHLKRILEQRR